MWHFLGDPEFSGGGKERRENRPVTTGREGAPSPLPGGIARVSTNPKAGALRRDLTETPWCAPCALGWHQSKLEGTQFIVEFTSSKRLQTPPTAHNGLGAEPGEGPMCVIPFSLPTLPAVNGRPPSEARASVCDPRMGSSGSGDATILAKIIQREGHSPPTPPPKSQLG